MAISLSLGFATLAGAQSANWISQFGTADVESGAKVAADGVGGVFVATGSGAAVFGPSTVLLARYDGSGQQVWTQTIASGGRDEIGGAASDGTGGLLACGTTDGSLGGPSAGGSDGWVGRFDAAGGQVWLTQIGSTVFDSCLAVAEDGAGGVFVCGTTQGDLSGTSGSLNDAWLARLDATGNVTWIRQYDSGATETATGLAVDGVGGLYLCGTTTGDLFGSALGQSDAWVARLDLAGNPIWGEQWGSMDIESAPLVALDGAGGIFVAGNTNGDLGISSAGSGDVWITRFNQFGNLTWLRQFGSPENDACADLASDLTGGIYLTGSTTGVLGASSLGGLDAWVARYDLDGDRTWLRQFGSTAADRASGVAVFQPGQFFLGGSTGHELAGPSAGQDDAWVASFDSLLAATYCSSPANSTGAPAALMALGSSAVGMNRLRLRCESLPRFVFGYVLASRTQGFAANPSGSQGNLCVSGAVGRFVGPGQVQNSGGNGVIELAVDLSALPQPLGFVSAQAGETWNFQTWFRDANPTVTSNFSPGVAVHFF
ncbi:SBBP repeat-containing protein [Saltatorellus ferox]|uniref:SBBP repeat-containing protein n=1 Tax=Saltatorellus ferox TaxID=2528018 RepID=UPI003AF38F8A